MLAGWLALPAAAAGVVPVPVRIAGANSVQVTGPTPASYPYRPALVPSLDAYGFVAGQCTSFVAWWLNTHGVPFAVVTVGPRGAGRFLNAAVWDEAARTAGFAVGTRPVVGAIAQWRTGEISERVGADGRRRGIMAGAPGHVAVVTRLRSDGQAEWAEYGWGGRPTLHGGFGFAPRYLYIGVPAPASEDGDPVDGDPVDGDPVDGDPVDGDPVGVG